MKFTGDEYAKALKDWVSADLKESPRQQYDLGKFFFTVSIGTIGALVAMQKGGGHLVLTPAFSICLLVLFASLCMALFMAMPVEQPMSSETELQQAHNARIRATIDRAVAWFGLWLVGAIMGGIALLV